MSSLRMARLLLAAAYEARTLAFDPDQARDEFGRWTLGPSSDRSWKKEDRKNESLNGVSFQEESSPDFSRSVNKTIDEPPFPDLPRGKHAAAGVVVALPRGVARATAASIHGAGPGHRRNPARGRVGAGACEPAGPCEGWRAAGSSSAVLDHRFRSGRCAG